ncbi:MAG: amidohydrolase family protein [Acidobacteria bacterium]|nr:amidohydrolase family protein [Acidobacteriota bacterium]
MANKADHSGSNRLGLQFANIVRLLIAVALFLSPGTLKAQQKIPPPTGWADTVLVNGKFATMNDSQRFVEALAIQNGRIVALGTRQQVEPYQGPQTQVTDLKGKTVVPGLITVHDHPHLWISWFHSTGSKLNHQWDSVPAVGRTPEEARDAILRTVQGLVQQRKPNEWILIRSDEDASRAITMKHLTQAQLDGIAPENPVVVRAEIIDAAISKTGKTLTNVEAIRRAYDGYGTPLRSAARNIILNSKAEQILQSKGVLDSLQGASPTGTNNAIMTGLIPQAIGLDAYAEAIRRELQFWAETQGVTTIATTIVTEPTVVTTFSKMARENKLPIRLAWYTSVDKFNFGSVEGAGTPHLWNVGVEFEGVVLEEVIASDRDPTLYGTELGRAATYASNLPLIEPRLEKFRADFITAALRGLQGSEGREAIMRWLRQGVRVGDVHCYSDGAIDMFLGILRQLKEETGWSEETIRNMRNFYLTHNSLVRPDQIPELKRWGLVVGPSWRTMYNFPQLKIAYGEEVKKYLWPVKTLLDSGVRVAANVDMSPTIGPEGEGMWDILEFLVDREYAGEEWNKAEAVDRWDALKTLTIHGAFVVLREDEFGSLEVGKQADVVVLDKDYFTIPAKEIGSITPLVTMVGGKVIHRSPSF